MLDLLSLPHAAPRPGRPSPEIAALSSASGGADATEAPAASTHVPKARAGEALVLLGQEGNVLAMAPAVEQLLEHPAALWKEQGLLAMIHAADRPAALRHLGLADVAHTGGQPLRCRFRRPSGGWRALTLHATQLLDAGNHRLTALKLAEPVDLTDAGAAAEAALRDPLTGLPNRALFLDRLSQAVGRSRRRSDRCYAVLFIDLDHFKRVNDRFGHLDGDQLLVSVARRLESVIRPGDTAARLGGDEFVLLLEDLDGEAEAARVAAAIQQALRLPCTLSGHAVVSAASVGIALGDGRYRLAEEPLRDADVAMYAAKARGGAQSVHFAPELREAAKNQEQLAREIRCGVEHNEFVLHYQPIIDLRNGAVAGVEALVRWQHPTRGLLAPAAFLPTAEATGLMLPLGRWILHDACRRLVDWRRQRLIPPVFAMSVNLSPRQFAEPTLLGELATIFEETGARPADLWLEITEAALAQDGQAARQTIERLCALGASVCLDDFGTGYSQLATLAQLPIDRLKLDRSFLAEADGPGEGTELVRTLVELAHRLGKKVVAEGVESESQLALLRELGCDYEQGYLCSKPLPSGAIERILTVQRR